jgi:hypothetical protein
MAADVADHEGICGGPAPTRLLPGGSSTMSPEMDDLIRHGIEARKDWRAYHTAAEEAHPRYHNRPECWDGSLIEDNDIREGTDDRPLCDECRSSKRAPGRSRPSSMPWDRVPPPPQTRMRGESRPTLLPAHGDGGPTARLSSMPGAPARVVGSDQS